MDVAVTMRYAQAAEITTLRVVKAARQLALDFDKIVNHTFTLSSVSVML